MKGRRDNGEDRGSEISARLRGCTIHLLGNSHSTAKGDGNTKQVKNMKCGRMKGILNWKFIIKIQPGRTDMDLVLLL